MNPHDRQLERNRLVWRAGDLAARLLLSEIEEGLLDQGNFEGALTLAHAEQYLADRLAYELGFSEDGDDTPAVEVGVDYVRQARADLHRTAAGLGLSPEAGATE